jgi:hypothetical protein
VSELAQWLYASVFKAALRHLVVTESRLHVRFVDSDYVLRSRNRDTVTTPAAAATRHAGTVTVTDSEHDLT